MSIRLEIPHSIAVAAHAMAQNSGVSPEHLMLQALHAHFPPLEPALQTEFEAWERASDEDEYADKASPETRPAALGG